MPRKVTRRAAGVSSRGRGDTCHVEQKTEAGASFEITGGKELHCIECKHCLFERIDCDGPLMPRCGNPAARSFDHGLDVDAAACHLFEAVPGGTTYRLVNVEHAQATIKPSTARRKRNMHTVILGLAGLALLAIAVAQVVKEELLNLFR